MSSSDSLSSISLNSHESVYSSKRGSKNKECETKEVVKIVAIVLAILGFITGIIGLLAYLGQINITLPHFGALTQNTALILMLAGIGAACIIPLIFGVDRFLTVQKDPSKSFMTNPIKCCDKSSDQNFESNLL